ncbi:MAG: ice-binding family protein [Betaproteobacteria bacterium]
MNGFESYSKRPMWFVALLAVAFLSACGSGSGGGQGFGSKATAAGAGTGVGGAGRGPAPVVMGTAANFRILAQSAITNVPASVVTGEVGLSPGTGAGIGLSCPEVNGGVGTPVHAVDAAGPAPCSFNDAVALTTAVNDAGTADVDALSRAPDYTELGAGNIGGLNFGPATYKWSTGVLIPSNLTLTGGPNDVWIFQIAQGLTVSPGVQVILAGGALPQNIYWATFAAASLDTTSKFKGTILSQSSITMKTGASINGRLLAATAVNLDTNAVGP